MAGEALEKAGMHFDDLNRIRVLDEDTASQVSFEFETHPFHTSFQFFKVYVEIEMKTVLHRLKSCGRFARTFWATLGTSRKLPTASSSFLTPCQKKSRPRR